MPLCIQRWFALSRRNRRRGTFCFWHDSAANKESLDLKDRLGALGTQEPVFGGDYTSLRQLEGIELGGPEEVDLSKVDFFHANLKKAQLTNVNLSDSNIQRPISQGI